MSRNNAEEKPLIVIGSGGHAKVLVDTALALDRKLLCLTDSDRTRHGQKLLGITVTGTDDEILKHAADEIELVNGIGSVGDLGLRDRIAKTWIGRGYRFATLVHPAAYLGREVRLGAGTQVMAGAVIQSGTVVGEQSIINTRASVDHDGQLGACCHISPGAILCGNVLVGDRCHVGAGATIIQGRKIGHGTVIGAGAVVTQDLPADVVAVGVPATVKRSLAAATAGASSQEVQKS